VETIQTDVSTRVSQALWDDPRTSDAVIEVMNKNGVVTLSGIVGSKEILQAAEEIARAQQGVFSVVNELKVG
jgi:osmotically-inducible protein OsmY